jgi:UDP-N-acetylglucosamine--N-acetylmuramyl-(pentapeptide) pyrophosphoryl-undecaprenol N-acetylglucosamine transferase
VVVPLPTATDDHQRKNAQVLVDAGAAVMVEERDLGGGRLTDVVLDLLSDPGRRARMAGVMRSLARPAAAARIADRVWELAS